MLASVIAWLQANWESSLVVLLAVDKIILGFFPQAPLLSSLGDILNSILGKSQAPKSLK